MFTTNLTFASRLTLTRIYCRTPPLSPSRSFSLSCLRLSHCTARPSLPRLNRAPCTRLRTLRLSASRYWPAGGPSNSEKPDGDTTVHENIYTLPNALTVSRILACPVLGWSILQGDFYLATGLLTYAGVTDWVDGYLARKFQMRSVLGTILDPAADKILMTTLTVTLAMKGLLPVPLAVLILGRDVLLGISAFYIRYQTLPLPKTFKRYWDFSIPSAEVRPTQMSKINTVLQLLLMGLTTCSPLLTFEVGIVLRGLQWTVAGTTLWTGISYAFFNESIRLVRKKSPPP